MKLLTQQFVVSVGLGRRHVKSPPTCEIHRSDKKGFHVYECFHVTNDGFSPKNVLDIK